MSLYELTMMDKHTHNDDFNIRGSNREDKADAQEWFVFFCLLTIMMFIARCIYMRHNRRPIVIVEHFQASYIEPVGLSTSINLETRSPLLEQRLSPTRKSRSQDPLEMV